MNVIMKIKEYNLQKTVKRVIVKIKEDKLGLKNTAKRVIVNIKEKTAK